MLTVTAKGTGGAASADFAHRGFTGQGHHRVKQVTLPEPFGSRRVLGFAEPDGGWLGPMADGLTVSPYICLAERSLGAMMRTLNAVRLISSCPGRRLGRAGVQPWRRPAVNQWRTRSQYCARGGAWITGSSSVKATSGWQLQAALCSPRHSSAGTVASPRNRALGTPRRCSRLTEWRRPCAGRESMSRRVSLPRAACGIRSADTVPARGGDTPSYRGPVSRIFAVAGALGRAGLTRGTRRAGAHLAAVHDAVPHARPALGPGRRRFRGLPEPVSTSWPATLPPGQDEPRRLPDRRPRSSRSAGSAVIQ